MKKFRDILSDMASWIALTNSKVTNFRPGSVVRSILEAIAMSIEDIYSYARKKFEDAQVGAIFNSFDIEEIPELHATGTVTVTFTVPLNQAVLIPKGTQYYSVPIEGESLYFSSTSDVTAPIGSIEIDVPVKCDTAGTVGNVPSYSITRAVSITAYMAGVYNKYRFFTGAPKETREQRRKRFDSYLDSIRRGTTPAVEYGLLQIPEVYGVKIQEDIGMIYVFVHDSNGNLPTAVRTKVEQTLFEYKTAGVKAIVSGVTKKVVNLNIKLTLAENSNRDTILFKVEDEVNTFINRLTVAKPLNRVDLLYTIKNVDTTSILNIDLQMAEDIIVEQSELVRPGIITVTEVV
ncbi:hypothetical protein EalM132_00084 [Exiguobacterium phage vB_EalM-132]|nr:hypothetical protein EalM132_00084 [Exiguobacterium phage vB_EalM-132]